MKLAKREIEARELAENYGFEKAGEMMGISKETVRRYCRKRTERGEKVSEEEIVPLSSVMSKISERYSDKELRLIASGGMPMEHKHTAVHEFGGERLKIGFMGDTHIGSVYTDYDYIKECAETFKAEKVNIVVHTGDVTEGVSNRAGHVYECTEYGYDAQKSKAVELMSQFDFCTIYMIDGNHDRWYIKNSGAMIVKDICEELPCAKYLGHDEGDINIDNKIIIKLWHGEDGSSYAHSYRMQKLIESLQGGSKPNILFAGHVHKYINFLERNIHCVSTGSIQKQSKWMRSKRLPAHCGFGIATATINDKGVGRFSSEFFPFYA